MKEFKTNIGMKIKDVRTGRKISRKDLAFVCHPNTLRNFEIGENQMNVEDFYKILIELGYTDFNLNDGLETVETKEYEKYIQICDQFDFYQVQQGKNSSQVNVHAKTVQQNIELYFTTSDYARLPLVLQQNIQSMYLELGYCLGNITGNDVKHAFELLLKSLQKGQTAYSHGEIALTGALCKAPEKKEKSFYKICDRICETLSEKSRLKQEEYNFIYNYIEMLRRENSRKFNIVKNKYAQKASYFMHIFNDVKK